VVREHEPLRRKWARSRLRIRRRHRRPCGRIGKPRQLEDAVEIRRIRVVGRLRQVEPQMMDSGHRVARGAEPPYRARNFAAMTWSASARLNIDSNSRSTGSASASRPSRRSSSA
jgi:hypothetical protein